MPWRPPSLFPLQLIPRENPISLTFSHPIFFVIFTYRSPNLFFRSPREGHFVFPLSPTFFFYFRVFLHCGLVFGMSPRCHPPLWVLQISAAVPPNPLLSPCLVPQTTFFTSCFHPPTVCRFPRFLAYLPSPPLFFSTGPLPLITPLSRPTAYPCIISCICFVLLLPETAHTHCPVILPSLFPVFEVLA